MGEGRGELARERIPGATSFPRRRGMLAAMTRAAPVMHAPCGEVPTKTAPPSQQMRMWQNAHVHSATAWRSFSPARAPLCPPPQKRLAWGISATTGASSTRLRLGAATPL